MMLRQLIKYVFNSNLEQDIKIAIIEQMCKKEKKIIKVNYNKEKKAKMKIKDNKKLIVQLWTRKN